MTGVAPTLTDCSMIRSVCTSQGSNWGKKPIAIAHLGSRDGSLNGHTYQLCTAWSLTHTHTHTQDKPARLRFSDTVSHTLITDCWPRSLSWFCSGFQMELQPHLSETLTCHRSDFGFFYPGTHLARCWNCYWVGLAHFALSFDNQQLFWFGHHGPLRLDVRF